MDGSLPIRAEGDARIGPNAILQTVTVLDRHCGRPTRDRILALAGVDIPPPDSGMVPEADCIAVHRAVRLALGDASGAVLRLAGLSTADYILAHRIPRPAQLLLRSLPGPLGARLLTAAITRHAWTFVGSGRFTVESHRPLTFRIDANPLAPGPAEPPGCPWHAAVFERLFARLVWPSVAVEETSCGSVAPGPCRFVLHPRGNLRLGRAAVTRG